jgi:hypothetical protein
VSANSTTGAKKEERNFCKNETFRQSPTLKSRFFFIKPLFGGDWNPFTLSAHFSSFSRGFYQNTIAPQQAKMIKLATYTLN